MKMQQIALKSRNWIGVSGYAHKGRNESQMQQQQIRPLFSRGGSLPKDCHELAKETECPNRTCNESDPSEKKSFWQRWFAPIEDPPPIPKPHPRCCRKRNRGEKDDPDLSAFGGQAYRTCGHAFVIQRDLVPVKSQPVTKEERLLHIIEAHPQIKNARLEDPLDDIADTILRQLARHERRQHPLHRRKLFTPYTPLPEHPKLAPKERPILHDELAHSVSINTEMFEKKNLHFEYKRAVPPAPLGGHLCYKRPKLKWAQIKKGNASRQIAADSCRSKRTVFHSLNQPDLINKIF